MSEKILEVNEIIEKIYNGEFRSKDDVKMALRLILNANGTELEDQKNRIRDLVLYSTKTKEIDGVLYIPVDDILKIVEES